MNILQDIVQTVILKFEKDSTSTEKAFDFINQRVFDSFILMIVFSFVLSSQTLEIKATEEISNISKVEVRLSKVINELIP
jgi:hypothetical protein